MSTVVVTVGTDHHQFNRLMDWIEAWGTVRTEVDLLVQHGSSRPVLGASNADFLPHDVLQRWFTKADVIVAQGGPGGIMDARRAGVRPIVVPRLAHLHEVVDDHQVAFARLLARQSMVHLAESESALHTLLDAAIAGQLDVRGIATDTGGVQPAWQRVSALLSEQSAMRRRRGLALRRRVRTGHAPAERT